MCEEEEEEERDTYHGQSFKLVKASAQEAFSKRAVGGFHSRDESDGTADLSFYPP